MHLYLQAPNDEDLLIAAAVLHDHPRLFESNVRMAIAGGYLDKFHLHRSL